MPRLGSRCRNPSPRHEVPQFLSDMEKSGKVASLGIRDIFARESMDDLRYLLALALPSSRDRYFLSISLNTICFSSLRVDIVDHLLAILWTMIALIAMR